jgi:uncharacterized phage infection (PIP) family protein YhgE
MPPMTGRLGLLMLLVTALALAAAGCGGDDENDATTEWAGDVCSSISTWQSSITDAVNSVKDNPTLDGVDNAVTEAKDATKTFTDDLQGLGKPETDAGQQAQDALQELSSTVDAGIQQIEQSVQEAKDAGASSALSAVSEVSATIATLTSQVTTTWTQLQNLNGGQELKDAFDNAGSCDDLRTTTG